MRPRSVAISVHGRGAPPRSAGVIIPNSPNRRPTSQSASGGTWPASSQPSTRGSTSERRWSSRSLIYTTLLVTPLERQNPEKNTECETFPSVPPPTTIRRSSGLSQISTRSPSTVQSPWGMFPSGG